MEVRLGEHIRSSTSESLITKDFLVSKVIILVLSIITIITLFIINITNITLFIITIINITLFLINITNITLFISTITNFTQFITTSLISLLQVIRHESYNQGTQNANDIGLVSSPVLLADPPAPAPAPAHAPLAPVQVLLSLPASLSVFTPVCLPGLQDYLGRETTVIG